MGNRTLSVIRLSDYRFEDDTSGSPTKQREKNSGYAAIKDLEIIGEAADLDVSASIPPMDRPELGDWLKNRAGEFDVILAWKLDRLARSLRDFLDLVEWAQKNGKAIVCVDDPVDLTTPNGLMFAQFLAMLAQWERNMIAHRSQGEHDRKIREGLWRGGSWPYGFRPEETPDGKRLVQDPVTAEILRDIVSGVIAGQSINSVCADLNKRGIPTALDYQHMEEGHEDKVRGSKWMSGTLGNMLRSKTLIGQYEGAEPSKDRKGNKGKVFRGRDGLPVQRAEPLITQNDWDKLQEILNRNKDKRAGNRKGGSFLLRIGFCGICERPLYPGSRGGRKYYRCASNTVPGVKSCGNKSVYADILEPYLVDTILSEIGDSQLMREVVTPGEDHTEELKKVEKALSDVRDEKDSGLYETEDELAEYKARVKRLTEQRRHLKSLPQRETEVHYEPTGETFREHWGQVNETDRSQTLRSAKVNVHVDMTLKEEEARFTIDLGDLEYLTWDDGSAPDQEYEESQVEPLSEAQEAESLARLEEQARRDGEEDEKYRQLAKAQW